MPTRLSNLKRWIDARRGTNSVDLDLTGPQRLLEAVNALDNSVRKRSDVEIRSRVDLIRSELERGSGPDSILPEFFALAREAASRSVGMRPFDVQILAAIGLSDSRIVEMKTGEGKTLAAVLPAALAALEGRGVHILTFNDYLARRDAEWMRPVYEFLGLTVGFVAEEMGTEARRSAYACDVTYATAKEAGFDFLRTHLARDIHDVVIRPYHFAIVDEADSIMIDEGRTPLVIAGEREQSDVSPYRIAEIIGDLTSDLHWETDEHRRNVNLTDSGLSRVEESLGGIALHDDEHYTLLTEVNQALHAQVLLHRDVDYIVRDGVIELVDEFTGRVVTDRRWPDGLQAAIEAKEGVAIQPGGRILGSITMQHFLRQYPRLSGMTATAQPAADELFDLYSLRTLPIPPNRPCIRLDHPDEIYSDLAAKDAAIVREVSRANRLGRPVLLGTRSVEESERVERLLAATGLRCRVLNARNDELEAEIIAEAGRPGTITISTNMSGRGTDIRLGGADERERDAVVRAGGLHVIGTNRHESRRIDDQLRGRAGRQGDPGSSRFIVSLEDDLMVRFGIDELIPPKLRPTNRPEPLAHPVIRAEVDRLQRIVEGQNFDIRKTLLEYSSLVEAQRTRLHDWRMSILSGFSAPDLLSARSPERYRLAAKSSGDEVLLDLERLITLNQIDEAWADHLSFVARVREGIHLVGLGGLKPINEFRKQVGEAFDKLLHEIEDRIVETFESIAIGDDGIDPREVDLQGPSATWTYLVNDHAVGELQQMLFGEGSYATAAGAALMTGPLLLIWGIRERARAKRTSNT